MTTLDETKPKRYILHVAELWNSGMTLKDISEVNGHGVTTTKKTLIRARFHGLINQSRPVPYFINSPPYKDM